VACCFYMTTERDAFITSLAKFTHLSTLREMSHKRVASINILLNVAIHEADQLQSTWRHVLSCISQVEKLHLIGIGAKQEAEFFVAASPNSRSKMKRLQSVGDMQKKLEEDREAGILTPMDSRQDAEDVLNNIDHRLIDEIFMQSG